VGLYLYYALAHHELEVFLVPWVFVVPLHFFNSLHHCASDQTPREGHLLAHVLLVPVSVLASADEFIWQIVLTNSGLALFCLIEDRLIIRRFYGGNFGAQPIVEIHDS
jgi:hypothetical protein